MVSSPMINSKVKLLAFVTYCFVLFVYMIDSVMIIMMNPIINYAEFRLQKYFLEFFSVLLFSVPGTRYYMHTDSNDFPNQEKEGSSSIHYQQRT